MTKEKLEELKLHYGHLNKLDMMKILDKITDMTFEIDDLTELKFQIIKLLDDNLCID